MRAHGGVTNRVPVGNLILAVFVLASFLYCKPWKPQAVHVPVEATTSR